MYQRLNNTKSYTAFAIPVFGCNRTRYLRYGRVRDIVAQLATALDTTSVQ